MSGLIDAGLGFEVATWRTRGSNVSPKGDRISRRSNQGLGFYLEMDPKGWNYLDRLEKIGPQILRRAQGRAADAAKRALFSTMRRHGSAKYGVPKLAKRQSITRRLHGGRPSEVFGKFSTDSSYHVAYIRGNTQVIGWADRLHEFMSALQSAENRDITDGEKRAMRAILSEKGEHNVRLPSSYSRPDRSLIEPFGMALSRVYPGWVIKNFSKMYYARVARSAQ